MRIYDVWADWCAPCKRFSPIFEKVGNEFKYVDFIKVNADENHEFLDKYDIRSIPTILIVDDSNTVVFRHAGILSESVFRNLVATLILQSHK